MIAPKWRKNERVQKTGSLVSTIILLTFLLKSPTSAPSNTSQMREDRSETPGETEEPEGLLLFRLLGLLEVVVTIYYTFLVAFSPFLFFSPFSVGKLREQRRLGQCRDSLFKVTHIEFIRYKRK